MLRPCPDDWVLVPGRDAAGHVAVGMSPAWDLAPSSRSGLGEPIYAAADGLVVPPTGRGYSEWGTYCRVQHVGGLETGYAHLSDLSVVVGQFVLGGQVIGLAGDSGLARGVHLHFETWLDGTRIDPAPYMGLPGGGQ